jgi:hypothetical protein
MSRLSAILLILILVPIAQVSAQVSTYKYNAVSITLDPEVPTPNAPLTAYIQSSLYNLDSQHIEWYVDSKRVKSGIGVTSITMRAPSIGDTNTITVYIGDITKVSTTITPSAVDLLWEADTITPPWYLGRALPTSGSYIKALALPHTTNNNNNLIFKWYKNGRFITKTTGSDQSTIRIKAPGVYNSYILSVDVLNPNGSILARGGATIHSVAPEVHLYKTSPLLGVLHNIALAHNSRAYSADDAEPTLTAVPFYFSLPTNSVLSYKWRAPNMLYSNQTPDTLTIIRSAGSSDIRVAVTNTEELMQSASTKYKLNTQVSTSNTQYNNESNYQFNLVQ